MGVDYLGVIGYGYILSTEQLKVLYQSWKKNDEFANFGCIEEACESLGFQYHMKDDPDETFICLINSVYVNARYNECKEVNRMLTPPTMEERTKLFQFVEKALSPEQLARKNELNLYLFGYRC